MMKKVGAVLLAMIAVMAIAAFAADGPKWFDMENCSFCKALLKDPNFLPNCSWDHYVIENGFVNITTYDPKVEAAWKQVSADMKEAEKRMMAGEQLNMCGMCQDFGKLLQMGAKYEMIDIKNGSLTLVTGNTPELVEAIKAHANRNSEEMAKMMEEMGSHEGHEH